MSPVQRYIDKFSTEYKDTIEKYRITILLIELLIIWYIGIQHGLAVALNLDVETYRYFFTFEAISQPSPGWVLSGISHGYFYPIRHFAINIIMLAVFGVLSEPHIRDRDYLLLFFGLGVLGSIIQVGLKPESGPVNGSSAAIYALTMIGTIHFIKYHRSSLDIAPSGNLSQTKDIWMRTRSLLIYIIPIVVPILIALELFGIRNSGMSAVISHGTGLIVGILYVTLQSKISDVPCLTRNEGDRTFELIPL